MIPPTWSLVPLDDRPCTRGFVGSLAPLLGARVEQPPAAALGWCREAGKPDEVLAWLAGQAPGGLAVVSLDMLLYGGLIASRSLEVPEESVAARLEATEAVLADLQARGTEVAAFNVLMRVPPYCTAPADVRLAEHLHAWSQLAARQERSGLGGVERVRLAWLERRLEPSFRARYLAARQRNHRMNRAFLGWPARGIAGFALLGMDDSRTEGFNVQERQALEPLVGERSAILPGADELALLLMARQATRLLGRVPRVAVHLVPAALGLRVTRYEDRSVEALVRAHCAVLGIAPQVLVGEAQPPLPVDLHLYVHGGPRSQAEAAVQVGVARPGRRHHAAAGRVAAWVAAGAQVAIADLGYANGGDRALVQALGEALPLVHLAAYAGWNTAGNTVGTALAHGVLRWLSLGLQLEPQAARVAGAAHAAFLLERLVDDVAYQGRVRQEVALGCTARGLNIYDLGAAHREVEEAVRSRLRAEVQALVVQHFAGQQVAGGGGVPCVLPSQVELAVTLPWPRLFEVEVAAHWLDGGLGAGEGGAFHG